MEIPKFSKGETLTAEKLNRLADAVKTVATEQQANRLSVGNGFSLMRSSTGTTLSRGNAKKID